MKTGPVSGWIRFRLAAATVAGVEVRLNWLSSASRVWKMILSPGLAVATTGMSGCQRLWHVPRFSIAQGTGTPPTSVIGTKTVFSLARPGAPAQAIDSVATARRVRFCDMAPSPERVGELSRTNLGGEGGVVKSTIASIRRPDHPASAGAMSSRDWPKTTDKRTSKEEA